MNDWRPMKAEDLDIVRTAALSVGEAAEDRDGNLWWRINGGDWFPAEFEEEIRWTLGWTRPS